MNQLSVEEFRALRATIRSRGGLRLALSLAGFAAWALTLAAVLTWLPNPVAGTVPLLLLLATFEINRMLHLGVERIGRYLQVFFEEAESEHASAPRWERTAMILGPSVPGAGGHPLLLGPFILATLINSLAVVLPGPTSAELAVWLVPHVCFAIWIVYTDRGMRKQRVVELERFRQLRRESQPR